MYKTVPWTKMDCLVVGLALIVTGILTPGLYDLPLNFAGGWLVGNTFRN